MADQRITQLNQLAEADVAAIDVLPIVDISASETKKVTAKDLFEAGAALADSSSIDLSKLNQGSATKLGTAALADDAITAAKLANDSSIAYDSVEPIADNFEGRGYVNSATKYLKVYDGAAYQQVVAPTAGIEDFAITAAKIASGAVDTTKIDAAGLGTAAIADDAITGAKIASDTITTDNISASGLGAAAIASEAIDTSKINPAGLDTSAIADDAVTGAKLADDSATVVDTTDPSAPGEFVGQQWINANTGLTRIWDGTDWIDSKAVQTLTFTDATPLTFAVTYPTPTSAEVTTTLDTQAAATVFAGPTAGNAATPTFRALEPTDLPIADADTVGVLRPGTGLVIDGSGALNHLNAVTTGTYTKVTVDAQGHVTTGNNLAAADIPDLDASKITTGTFASSFLAPNSVTAEQLADYGIAQVSETQPVPEFAGQWWINPSDRSAYIWIGAVSPEPNGYWLLVGYGSPTQLNLRFGGTYDATANTVTSLNQYGVEAGLTIGQPLAAPNTSNNGLYLAVTTAGTGTTPAPVSSLAVGDWVLSQGTGANWTKVAVISGASGTFNDYDILSDGTYFTPDMPAVADVRDALELLWGRVQIATTAQLGVVKESTEVLVDNSTGEMTIGVVDEGTY